MNKRHWWLWGFSFTLSMAACVFFYLAQEAILLHPELYVGTDDLPEPYGAVAVIGLLMLNGITLFFAVLHIVLHVLMYRRWRHRDVPLSWRALLFHKGRWRSNLVRVFGWLAIIYYVRALIMFDPVHAPIYDLAYTLSVIVLLLNYGLWFLSPLDSE